MTTQAKEAKQKRIRDAMGEKFRQKEEAGDRRRERDREKMLAALEAEEEKEKEQEREEMLAWIAKEKGEGND